MTIFVNYKHYSLLIPYDVLSALGDPKYIQLRWNIPERRIVKDKYQATQDKVKGLLEKKKKQNQKELLDAYEKTSRSHEEILRFMLGSDDENEG